MLTVDVISPEQTSQIYFKPPSVPLVTVFFLITPILSSGRHFGLHSSRTHSNKSHRQVLRERTSKMSYLTWGFRDSSKVSAAIGSSLTKLVVDGVMRMDVYEDGGMKR